MEQKQKIAEMLKAPYRAEKGKAALVIIDAQNAVYAPGEAMYEGQYPAPEKLVPVINKLISFFREREMPIIWITLSITPQTCLAFSKYFSMIRPPRYYLREGSEETKIWKEFSPQPEDVTVVKHHMSAFWETDLDTKLRSLDVEYPCFVGNNTDECVEGTIRDACVRLYNSITVSDAVGTRNGKEAQEIALKRLRSFSTMTTSDKLIAELS